MKNNKQHINDTFLAKFLLGETNKEEQKIVMSWLEEKDENRKHLDQLEQLWLESGKLKPRPIPVDKQLAWSKLTKRIQHYEKKDSPTIQRFSKFKLSLIVSAAASVLILIGLFNGYWDSTSIHDETIFANTSQTVLHDTLPDGSEIHLNQLAKLSYHNSNTKERIVTLSGEAFFSVKRDTLRPFIVHAGIGGVKVLGTSFKVKIEDNGDIAVDVKSGRVELFKPNNTKTDTLHLILNKNEGGMISGQQDTIIQLSSNASAFFWLDKRLSFRNKKLKDVFMSLELCYGVKIKTSDQHINNLYYSSSFVDEDVEKVIQVISKTFNLTYTREGNTFTLSVLEKNE